MNYEIEFNGMLWVARERDSGNLVCARTKDELYAQIAYDGA